jgi:alanine racemase
VVGLGYADGFPRALSGANNHRGAILAINGKPVPVVGRVSMDMIGVDVTDLAQVPAPGDMVEVLGRHVGIDDLADVAGTIGYEILTGLKGRYSRTYVESEPAAA